MGQLTASEIRQAVLGWMILTVLFGILASWIWTVRRLLRDEPILPETPLVERRKPSWGWGVLLIFVAYLVVNVGAFTGYTLVTRGRPPRKRAEAPARVEKQDAAKPGPAAAEGDPGPADPARPADRPPAIAAADRAPESSSTPGDLSWPELLFVQAAINSLLIVLLPLILRMTSGARLRDLGLSPTAWRRQVAIGVAAILWLLPIIYTVQALCVRYLDVPEEKDRAHPVQKMLQEDPTGSVAYLAVLTAVVLAPVFEELLFRGILQTWLIQVMNDLQLGLQRLRKRRQPAPPEKPETAKDEYWAEDPIAQDIYWAEDPSPETHPPEADFGPPASNHAVDSSMAKDLPYRPHSERATSTAIVLTSLLFASLHAAQWPAPIPLFILSVGLGLVSYRTGSLLAPICMHALFNGLSTLMMFLSLGAHADKDKPPPVPPPVERVAPLEKVKTDLPNVDRVRQGSKR